MLTAPLTKLKDILKVFDKDYAVYVPSDHSEPTSYVRWGEDTDILLTGTVAQSPKELFFPQTEKMYKCKTVKTTMQIENIMPEDGMKLIFGVRSCDMKSLECFDQVFLTKGFVDEFYKHKRDHSAIITLSCSEPNTTCFCTAMGIDPQNAPGADIQAHLIGDTIGFEGMTDLGRSILESIKGLLEEQDVDVPAFGEFVLKVDADGIAQKAKGMFDSAIWDDLCKKCLNCGACTFICPTCHCFDISQEVRGENTTKFRCWDSCMFNEYTMMAGGHNPRPTKKEKVRNRFMHKLSYFPERYGMLLCTGCGRCINVCPVNMDITSVIRMIKEAE